MNQVRVEDEYAEVLVEGRLGSFSRPGANWGKRDEAYSSSSECRWIKVEQADRVTVQQPGSPCLANPVKTRSVKKASQE
jgi:hypothetical protein